jgi:head-tail adaptor
MASGNTASILKQRIIIKRLEKTADGFGGYTPSVMFDIDTVWCKVQETKGAIDEKMGIRLKSTEIEIIIRKETADLIMNQDILQVEGFPGLYRINSGFQTFENFWTKMTATKIEE